MYEAEIEVFLHPSPEAAFSAAASSSVAITELVVDLEEELSDLDLIGIQVTQPLSSGPFDPSGFQLSHPELFGGGAQANECKQQ